MTPDDDAWEKDPEFQEHIIEEVRAHRLDEHGGNFTVKFDRVWVYRFDSPHWTPGVGQTIRLYGRRGFAIRGVVIEGHVVYYYPTEAAQKEALKS